MAWLFVPGLRHDRFETAIEAGAEAVIFDLEDSVAEVDKAAARERVASFVETVQPSGAWVRINAQSTSHYEADVRRLAPLAEAGQIGLVVPKVGNVDDLKRLRLDTRAATLIGLIETARGVTALDEVARTDVFTRFAFGAADLAADLGVPESSPTIDSARTRLVLASKAANMAAPIGSVTRAIRDSEQVSADARRDVAYGFGGKLLIHPAQVQPTHRAFAPSPEEVSKARQLLEATDVGVASIDGEMVDEPVMARARQILERHTRAEST